MPSPELPPGTTYVYYDESPLDELMLGHRPTIRGTWESYCERVSNYPSWVRSKVCICGAKRFENNSAIPVIGWQTLYYGNGRSVKLIICPNCRLLDLGHIYYFLRLDGCEDCERPFVNYPFNKFGLCDDCR